MNQIKANTSKIIEVREQEELISHIQMPVTARVFSTTMQADGELAYRTQFQPLKGLQNAIPLKWLWSKQVKEACLVKDRNDNVIGALRHVQSEAMLSYYEVGFMTESLAIYEVSKKHNLHLLIFFEGRQIGQIEKSFVVRNNLDRYSLFLLDDFARFKDLLILFVGYFDNWNYANIGEIVVSKKQVKWEWSYSKANKKYDKKWLPNHFAISEAHKAAIDNEQMNIGFKLLFAFVVICGLSVLAFNFWSLR
ncbi:hypothetical protein GZH47_21110 [Paenibacillus rhizovicinus]|uniref:Uncharacterized protein n=1 Tax=Paenibacillus rhizovicinus TaxID=2704463 RepID=A0A6C0P940_9BACL|nr:hypothetical protein [Paenibacillus rhizovicinus]QHW33052.1 hypothetical protein GZH47_21110 [Paenibacillus rhizovicinus]